jgi:alpha-tubulin suppressor-like RCC1 family protein
VFAVLLLGSGTSVASTPVQTSLSVRVTGLPPGQRPAVVVRGPGVARVLVSQKLVLADARPGRYMITVRGLRTSRDWRSVKRGAQVFPTHRQITVIVRKGRTTVVSVAYGAIVNPGVGRAPSGLLSVVGDPANPRKLVYRDRVGLPGPGRILTAAPSRALPRGLIVKVTASKRVGNKRVLSVTPVPVSVAVPEFTFTGKIVFKPAAGAVTHVGSVIPTQAGSAPDATAAKVACKPPKLLTFGAKLNSVELRQAFLGAWPPQMRLTLAVRTTESLGVGTVAVGINCDWDLGQLGPYQGGIPVGPIVIPVYATLPVTAGVHINGKLDAGTVNLASTTVAHAAAGFNENSASLSQEGSNVWITGVLSLSGSATLSASVGVQAGIGIAKGGNVHLQADFGPEFAWTSGKSCDLLDNLGSLSAGVQVFGKTLSTPSWTPFKLHLWSGCNPGGGGGSVTVTNPGGQTGTVGTPVGLQIHASDTDGGKLSYTATGLPLGLSMVPSTGLIIGTPTTAATSAVTVTATDASGPSGSTSFTWTINPTGGGGGGFAAAAVAAGYDHTCALLSGGQIDCWGNNGAGQLGDGTTTDSSTPVAVHGITNATQISTGYKDTCALLSGGQIDCWGNNGSGELGNGTGTATSDVPVAVSGITNATQITAGSAHTCALLSGGQIDCWGNNDRGRLGNGTTTSSDVPVAVSGITNATQITAGGGQTCALLSGGQIDCWGNNDFGDLGNGTTTSSDVPVAVSGITNATQITAGNDHTCALLSGGQIDCWGYGAAGELGNGTTTSSDVPVAVSGITNATQITAGNSYTCALLSGGQIDCWGYGGDGELGNGTTTNSDVPVAVSGITNATQITAGNDHTCALLSSGQIDCWGNNGSGELGNGTTTSSDVPVAVSGIP